VHVQEPLPSHTPPGPQSLGCVHRPVALSRCQQASHTQEPSRSRGEQRALGPQSRATVQVPAASRSQQALQRQPEPALQVPCTQSSGWPHWLPVVHEAAEQLQTPPAPQACPPQAAEVALKTAHRPQAFCVMQPGQEQEPSAGLHVPCPLQAFFTVHAPPAS
jgi:hypothetical protein